MRYKLFGQTGLRVSELVLGTGNFGTGWGYGTEPEEARKILDGYLDAGGNFIDTANAYQAGQSEQILGEALVGRRDELVNATKFAMPVEASASMKIISPPSWRARPIREMLFHQTNDWPTAIVPGAVT